jgi:hypothetical protein
VLERDCGCGVGVFDVGRYRVKRCSKCALCKIKSNSVEQREERKREKEREREVLLTKKK